ncbi:MAG: hypothetical protein Q9227_001203 [Pyrenula ochraceoflavens]
MSSSSTIVSPNGLVLVTGANGFIGSHIVLTLLSLNYRVRGTVRTSDKAAWVKEAVTSRFPSAHFETALVPDITVPNAYNEAVQGVDGIVHVAGDMSFSPDPNAVVTPMLKSLRGLLETAKKQPSVKRFVFTSSNQAALNRTFNKEFTIDKSTFWNETAVQAAWRPPPYEPDRIWDVYSALKTQSEQELFRFAREENPHFIVNSVLPCFTIGPIIHPKQPGSTGKWVMDFWRDPAHSEPLRQFGASYHSDTEDVALLHVAGLTQEDVKGERLFAFEETFNFNGWVKVFRELAPGKGWPEEDPGQARDLSMVDTKREVELLKRFGKKGWASFYDSVKRATVEGRS